MDDYWIRDAQGRVLGPIGLEVLRELVKAGRLRSIRQASRDGRHFSELTSFPEVSFAIHEALQAQQVEESRQEARHLTEQLRAMEGKQVHEVFGLPPDASINAFRASFFALVRRFYPDRLPSEAPEELRRAYGEMFHFLSGLMSRIEQRAQTPAAPPHPPSAPARTYNLEDFVGWERRDDNRIHAELRITQESVGLLTEQQSANVSNGGLFLATQQLLPLGERLQLTLHFDDPVRDVSARGVVVWQNEQPAPRRPRGVGVRFTHLEEADRRFLGYYVKKAQLRGAAHP